MKTASLSRILGAALGVAASTTIASAQQHGVLFTADNAAAGNHVWVVSRSGATLALTNSYATGGLGLGTADGLPSQGSILLSPDGAWLLVCNAGSGEISVFETLAGGALQLTDKVASGGLRPVSVAMNGTLVYVLNADGGAGSVDNVTAFHLGCGNLTMLPGSTRFLSGTNTGPAEVAITRDGEHLIVTEKASNLIDTWELGVDGLASSHLTFTSLGATPYGFAVGRGGKVFVSEAAGGAAGASSVSSYSVGATGTLTTVSAKVPTDQTAACWLALSPSGSLLYTGNAGAGTLSAFKVRANGEISLVTTGGDTANIGAGTHPADLAFSHNGALLFSLNNGNGSISAFEVKGNGSLQSMGGLRGLPSTAAGLAAW